MYRNPDKWYQRCIFPRCVLSEIGRTRDDDFPNDPELPVGLEILGVPLSEERILNIAAGVEALQHKK